MARRREMASISLSMLDLLSGALGAMMILYIAVPKATQNKLKDNSMSSLESAPPITKKKGQYDILPAHLGFKFKGKNIVFILDTSGSMEKEDRIGQVKAGLKFFMTSLPEDYKIDFINYPGDNGENFNRRFGELKTFTSEVKNQIFYDLYQIKPQGPTPTRDALIYALTHYPDLTDIVLLTDGAPTVGLSYTPDDIGGILTVVQRLNTYNVQINGLGIGRKFLEDHKDPKYLFLSSLARQSGGFFYGL